MEYKLTGFGGVIRLLDNASIPPDPRNVDFSEYQEWLKAGNTPEPADGIEPPKPVVELPKVEEVDQMTELSEIREVVKLLIEKLSS